MSGYHIGIACCIVLGFIIYYCNFSKQARQKFIERAKHAGNFTEGSFVRSQLRIGNDESDNSFFKNDKRKVTYQYEVGGRTYHKKVIFQSPGRASVYYPYTVTVYYDPAKPQKAVCTWKTK